MQRHFLPLLLCAVAFEVAGAPRAFAQPVFPRGRARVAGIVMDSATRQPILRVRACREVELNAPYGRGILCASPDSGGQYLLDGLPEGPQAVTVTCSGERMFSGRLLRHDTLQVSADEEGRLDVVTDAAGCDMRPLVSRRGVFRGHYTTGFEEGRFRPCADSIAAWVTFAPATSDSSPPWPKPNDPHYPSYYVRWEGTLRGPWRYGHLGVSQYELIVERVLEVRQPEDSDCR